MCFVCFKGVKYYSIADQFPLDQSELWSRDGVSLMLLTDK